MQAISFETLNDKFVISIDKELMSKEVIFRILGRFRLEYLIQQMDIEESVTDELSEEIKSDWWEKNKERILKRIQE